MEVNNQSFSLDDLRNLLSENNKNISEDTRKTITELSTRLDQSISELNSKMERLVSETRARHYDIQNISLANNGLSLSGHVSSSQAAGRSPRIKLNSFDTLH